MLLLKQIGLGLEHLIFPPKCLKCGTYLDTPQTRSPELKGCFCHQCGAAGVFPIKKPYCTLCGLQLPQSIPDHPASGENHACEGCLKKPLKLGKVRAAARYEGVLKDGIHLLKYQSKLSVAKPLEHMILKAFEAYFEKSDIHLIMPIPLHKKRLISRGFNQAFILIRNFSRHYKKKNGQPVPWQIDTRSLIRRKKTAPQTGFDINQRKNNLNGAFKVRDLKAVENKHILLVDDVLTTGATCNEAAKELLKNGAAKVDALVLARA